MQDKTFQLLNHVEMLRFYEAKLAHAQGDRFNVFELLGVGSREVSTHTPYLAEFLNSRGVHGLGAGPLELFVRRFGLNLDPLSTRVDQELHLGRVTAESGGRIDLLLTDDEGRQVAIENKIFAGDQANQLHRYQKELPRAQIVYLTRDGRQPSDWSIRDKDRIICLSYAVDIIAWQEECRRLAAAIPIVRETIAQYINLLKRLTGQSTNTQMSTQIAATVLKDEASLAAFYELCQAESAVTGQILAKLYDLGRKIAESHGLEFSQETLDSRYGWFAFSDASMRAQNISITFQFQTPNYRDLNFGISYHDPKKAALAPPGLLAGFQAEFGDGESVEWWPAVLAWRARLNWTNETFADIAFGRFDAELNEKVAKLCAIVRVAQAPISKES